MLSIVVTWRDRTELSQTLPPLVATARQLKGDVTIVNFGGSRSRLARDVDGFAPEVTVVDVERERWFNKSRAQNLGAAVSSAPLLFFCDCDVIVEPLDIVELAHAVQRTSGSFGTLAGVTESERNSRGGRHVARFGYQLDIRTADGRRLRIIDFEEDAETGTRQAPGLLLVGREDLLGIQGYNSRLLGWGWEDQDMICRLTLGAGLERLMSGHAIHVSHDDAARLQAYPPVRDRWENRDRMFRQALANYDRADFQGTYGRDIRTSSWEIHDGSGFQRRYLDRDRVLR